MAEQLTKPEMEAKIERDKARRARERQQQEEFMSNLWEGVGAAGTGALWGAIGPRGTGLVADQLFGFIPTTLLIGGVGLGVGFMAEGPFADTIRGTGYYGTGRWLEDMSAAAVSAIAAP